jgi:hypothetical protein
MNIVIDELVNICREHSLPQDHGVVIAEPYIPYIPKDWNRVLVLAEAQNLSDTNRSYVEGLKQQSPDARIRRLYGSSESIGIQPRDDGSLKLAAAAMFPSEPIDAFAVSNAVLWSMRTADGTNLNPDDALIQSSVKVWQRIQRILDPSLVIACGRVAHVLSEQAFSCHCLMLRLPARRAMSIMSGMFDQDDLLRRFPEVKSAIERHPSILSGSYSQNKIFFACHAVSLANGQTNHGDLSDLVRR